MKDYNRVTVDAPCLPELDGMYLEGPWPWIRSISIRHSDSDHQYVVRCLGSAPLAADRNQTIDVGSVCFISKPQSRSAENKKFLRAILVKELTEAVRSMIEHEFWESWYTKDGKHVSDPHRHEKEADRRMAREVMGA